ncbi:MAG: hypothetical protein H0W61_13230 [Bacteroidetes bacterium]|nr:hypothetical protein [Bacteroidota bacterium]
MKQFLIFLALSLSTNVANSQDTLYFKSKEKVIILLLEVNPDNIKYKRFDNQAGATYTVLKSEVEQIALSNGKKEVFASAPASRVTKTDSLSAPATTVIASGPAAPPVDTVCFRSGKKVPAKIYELSPTEVKYKPLSNMDGPVYKVNKSEVKEVVFSTGLKQSFNAADVPQYASSSGRSPSSMILKGRADAKANYRHTGGSVGTGVAAMLFPPIGLIPAIICSSVPPREYNLGYPDDNLWQNRDYNLGYSKEAYRIKRKRVWSGFGLGTLGFILLLFVVR